MDIEVDYYAALDLPSGEEGAKLSEIDISKAYRKRAFELYPDKKPDDPINAHFNFQKLKASYDIFKDEKKRLAELLKEAGRSRNKNPKSLENLIDPNSKRTTKKETSSKKWSAFGFRS